MAQLDGEWWVNKVGAKGVAARNFVEAHCQRFFFAYSTSSSCRLTGFFFGMPQTWQGLGAPLGFVVRPKWQRQWRM